MGSQTFMLGRLHWSLQIPPWKFLKLPDDSLQQANPFKLFYQQLQQNVEHRKTPNGFCIIIDSLNTLLNYSKNVYEVLDFLHYVRLLIEENEECSLVVLLHEDDEEQVLKAIAHLSSVIISVEPLETGYSKDITGQVSPIIHVCN